MKLFNKIAYLLVKMKTKFEIYYRSEPELRWGKNETNAFSYSTARYSFCKQTFADYFSFDRFKNLLCIFLYIQEITKANAPTMFWAHADRKVIDEILY